MTPETCTHIAAIRDVIPDATTTCPECVASGGSWVHLRVCLTCSHVGCCDNSQNRHARRHVEETGHPIIQSLEPGETWRYCFIDDIVVGDGRPFRVEASSK